MEPEHKELSHARHDDQRQIDEGPGSDRQGPRKPRTGIWLQQVVGAPGGASSVALAPARGSFDRQMTRSTLSRPLRARLTGGWSSGDLLRD